jgi:hypothetical protein
MDKLRPLGCCHVYAARDYSLEAEGAHDHSGHSGGDGAVLGVTSALILAQKKQDGLASNVSVPESPIMAR